jgi:hypothetical protein
VAGSISANFERLVLSKIRKEKECRADTLDIASTYNSITPKPPLDPA